MYPILKGLTPIDLAQEPTLEKAVYQSRRDLMTNSKTKFYGIVLLQLPMFVVKENITGATDGTGIILGRNYFMAQNASQRKELIIHEVIHVCMKHSMRLKGRNPRVWNVACDYAINPHSEQLGLQLSEGSIKDPKYADMSAEAIYDDIMANGGESILPPMGNGADMHLMPSPDADSKLPNGLLPEQAIDQAMQTAVIQMDMSGQGSSVPGYVREWLKELFEPKVSWQALLRKYMNAKSQTEYDMSRPNRRMRHLGIYLPTRKGKKMGKMIQAFDLSGSIGKHEFLHFVSESYAGFKILNPELLEIIQFDTDIISIDKVTKESDFNKIQFKGGGGTDLRTLFDHFIKTKAKLMIVLTDGYFYNNFAVPPRGQDVIWCIYNNPSWRPPFGKVVHLSFDNAQS